MSLIRKHGAVLQAWACLDLVTHRKWSPAGGLWLSERDGNTRHDQRRVWRVMANPGQNPPWTKSPPIVEKKYRNIS